MRATEKKQGGVQLIIMIVMLVFIVLSFGLFKLASLNAVESVREAQSEQAFWIAESGLQQTLQEILTDADYREAVSTNKDSPNDPDNHSPYEVTLDGEKIGEYSVEIWKAGDTNTITVVGTVGQQSRRMQLVAEVRPDISNILFVADGNAVIDQKCHIDGPLKIGGTLKLSADVIITNGTIYAQLLDPKIYEYIDLTESIEFEINEDVYKTEIDTAHAKSKSNVDGDLDLVENSTKYVHGTVTTGSITGSGTLVIDGDLNLEKNYTIGDDVTIILDGKIQASQGGTLGDGVNIFATGSASFDQATMSGTTGSSIIVCDNLNMDQSVVFCGLLMAGGKITFSQTPEITGAVISGDDLTISQLAVLIYDESKIPDWVFEQKFLSKSPLTSENTWSELSVAQ